MWKSFYSTVKSAGRPQRLSDHRLFYLCTCLLDLIYDNLWEFLFVFFFAQVSPEAAQQRQALQMYQLLPCLFWLCLTADPCVCSRHQKRKGLLLQHVRQSVHLGELEMHVDLSQDLISVHWFVTVLFFSCVFLQETYLMKHMVKHTVVEHVVSHHSPQHRTESPTLPIRISLI